MQYIKENFSFLYFLLLLVMEMDVVSDSKDFLSEFVSNLDTINEKPSEQIVDKDSDDAV